MATLGDNKSTIVRLWSGAGLAAMRAGFRALERASPAIAARWALRVWLSPPRRKPTRAPSGSGVPAGERLQVPAGVVAETWGDGPVVYLLHGWGGWRGQLSGFVAPLVAAGRRVVALDAPSHGDSAPGRHGRRQSTLTEMADALVAVAEVAGPPQAVISHSAGCAAAAIAVQDGLPAERLVLLAPMADPMPYLHAFADVLGIGERTRPRFLRRLERVAGRDLADFDLPSMAKTAETLPELLVVHDQDDRESPHADGAALSDAWPGAILHTTTGLGHRRLLADPEVIRTVVAYVTDAGV
jgi:pimeloyl-ACP methyl ester carboxylesterase